MMDFSRCSFQISHTFEWRQLFELKSVPNDYGVIRQPGNQIVERYFGHLHSEEYKPAAQVMKRMVDI